MVYSIENCFDVSDFLEQIDEFKKDKNKKIPLMRGYIRNEEKIFYFISHKNDNKIKIQMKVFTKDIIDRDIIVKSKLICKNFYGNYIFKLEIIDWLFIEEDENKNCQKTIKVIKSDSKIGILTNEKGDAISDIEAELNKENYKKYEIFSVFTQGYNAIVDISDKVKEINDKNQCNIILLSRGGGNESDIDAVFNNLDIIKTIQQSKIPIVTAIGHANDVTFSDLVAFDNATTPTSGIQIVLKLIKSAVEFKNNNKNNNNDKQLYLSLYKIMLKIRKFFSIFFKLIKSVFGVKNNNNDKQLYLSLYKIMLKIKKGFSEIINIEFSNQTIITNVYDENENIIILNWCLLIEILNHYNFKIYRLYYDNVSSNLNLKQKRLYLNETQLKETIDFVFFDFNNRVTNYNNDKKLLFINKNIVIN
ncbi:Exonuclease VII, large subunit [Candidatus Phytoplasma mali]|uniref:Exonuclease VII, large subunit n=1 Tax=Phytoplasma mali (strain AT) TaxID=482235 RepID=B3R0Q8_PHYMT|nr:exodeoxyribonuclease VII large subunit [Candidatus Phytoplasma mali]CAP18642.1 Exonuclease VII, large subunit [Candidatus Phytoplasma mali]